MMMGEKLLYQAYKIWHISDGSLFSATEKKNFLNSLSEIFFIHSLHLHIRKIRRRKQGREARRNIL